jgi:hypothetical protein
MLGDRGVVGSRDSDSTEEHPDDNGVVDRQGADFGRGFSEIGKLGDAPL